MQIRGVCVHTVVWRHTHSYILLLLFRIVVSRRTCLKALPCTVPLP